MLDRTVGSASSWPLPDPCASFAPNATTAAGGPARAASATRPELPKGLDSSAGIALEPMTILVILVIIVVWFWARSRERQAQEARDGQWELRFPTLHEYSLAGDTFRGRAFVDFEQMLLVDETSDYNFQHAKVFHLRRRDGPVWEICEEGDSRARSWAHLKRGKKLEYLSWTITRRKRSSSAIQAYGVKSVTRRLNRRTSVSSYTTDRPPSSMPLPLRWRSQTTSWRVRHGLAAQRREHEFRGERGGSQRAYQIEQVLEAVDAAR